MKKQKELSATNKTELQKYTAEEIKNYIFKLDTVGTVGPAMQQLLNGLWSSYQHGSTKDREKLESEMQKQVSAVLYGYEVETHMTMMESFGERFRGSAKEMCKQFIQDFDCKTNVEKSMAETAAMAFMRYLDASRRLNNCLDVNNQLSPVKTGYMAMLSKERDRAHRQYLSTVLTLKQLKSPTIEMTIKTKNTFVAQNQQINAVGDEVNTNYETNEGK